MNSFVEQATQLVGHKCFYDYCKAKEQDSTIEPELFFDVWSMSFMSHIDAPFKDNIWRLFLSMIVESRRAKE